MYKVGDEVLIKGEVIEVMNDVPYPVRVRLGSDNGGLVFTNDEVCYADKIVKTYEQGSADAWNLLKKVYDMKCETIEQIFGVEGGFWDVIRDFTYEEALAKIEAYEKEKGIKVGDVVEGLSGYKAVVTVIGRDRIQVMFDDGSHTEWNPKDSKKTGKHIDIESLLRQIGE